MTSIRMERGRRRPRLGFHGKAIVPQLVGYGPDSARFSLVAGGALLLGGDEVDIRIEVGAGCLLELADVGGTVAYDAGGEQSRWAVTVRVDDGGSLLWHGLPLVVSDGADVARTSRISLGNEAVLCLRDTIVLGRVGEQGGRVRQRTEVELCDGTPVFVEDLSVAGYERTPGVLGAHRVIDSVLLAGMRADSETSVEHVLQLEHPGSLGRYLGAATHESSVDTMWALWSAAASRWSTTAPRHERRETTHVGA